MDAVADTPDKVPPAEKLLDGIARKLARIETRLDRLCEGLDVLGVRLVNEVRPVPPGFPLGGGCPQPKEPR